MIGFLHVVVQSVVKGLDVALATLQLLLQLSKVVIELIQLTYIADKKKQQTFRATERLNKTLFLISRAQPAVRT